ncbi:MAG: hypothetical protein ABEH81_00970 [Halopenitus sp.]
MIEENSLRKGSAKNYDPDKVNNISQAIDLIRQVAERNRELYEDSEKRTEAVAADVFEECALLLEEELLSEDVCAECGEETMLMIRFSDGEYENYCHECEEWQDRI